MPFLERCRLRKRHKSHFFFAAAFLVTLDFAAGFLATAFFFSAVRAALALPGLPLQVLAVAREADATMVQRYAKAQGYSFPITLANAPLAAALSERRVIPLTAVVERSGRLKQILAGEMFEEDLMDLLQLVKA